MKRSSLFRERLRIGLGLRVIGLVVLTALISGGLIGVLVVQGSRTALRDDILGRNLGTADVVADLTLGFIEGAESSLHQLR